MEGIHISLKAEQIGTFLGLPITNTLLMTWVASLLIVTFAVVFSRKLVLVPGRLQTVVETAVGGGFQYVEETLENRKLARAFFPLIASLFVFILVSNWLEFIPGIGSVGFFGGGEHPEFTPILRSANTDINVTLALALIVFVAIEAAGIGALGALKYAGKFVNFKSVLGFLIGIIDLFSELARLISFSFRLFGNIFAGEVIIAIIIAFVPYFVPVPLLLFEVFVGFIQAAIFALLTLFFIKIAVTEHH